MIHSSRFTAILDACVIYPAPLRDLLLNLAAVELYKPKWTKEIQEEWINNLLLNRPDLKRESLNNTCQVMDAAFPDSNITDYEELIDGLTLPDLKDRHVLAAAIKSKADIIVTSNLKDFPSAYTRKYDIEVQHPDDFISNLINLDKDKVIVALLNQIESLKNPPKSKNEVLETLLKCGLGKSVKLLNE